MQAGHRVVVSEFAEDPLEAIEKFIHLEPMPAPDPATLRPHELLLAIRSVSVTWVDLLMTSGQYQHMPKPPYTPGMEYSGEVVAVGAAVLPQEAVHKIPQGFSFDQACCLLGNYETAYHCLVVRGQLQPGETVLINGASGSTGMAAVQMAKLLGATVIATGRSDAKLAEVKAHGADHVINARHPDDPADVRSFRDEVKALTGGQGVDVVYDAVGGATSLESLRSMAFGGRFLIVGWTSTPNVARGKGQRGAPNANQLPTNIIQMKSISVLGCPAVIAVAKNPALRTERLAKIWQWVEEGRILPHISHVLPLSEFKQALRLRWEGGITGSCILQP